MTKFLATVLMIILGSVGAVHGQDSQLPDGTSYCFTEFDDLAHAASDQEFYVNTVDGYYFNPDSFYYAKARWTCQERQGWLSGLSVIELGMHTASVTSLVCTGGSVLPVSIGLGVAGILTRVARLVVKNVPCEDNAGNAEIERQVKQTICAIAGVHGAECDLSNIQLRYVEEQNYTPMRYL